MVGREKGREGGEVVTRPVTHLSKIILAANRGKMAGGVTWRGGTSQNVIVTPR